MTPMNSRDFFGSDSDEDDEEYERREKILFAINDASPEFLVNDAETQLA